MAFGDQVTGRPYLETTGHSRQAKSRKRRLKAGNVRLTLIVPAGVRDGLVRLARHGRVTQTAVLENLLAAGLARQAAEARAKQAAINPDWAVIALSRVEELIASGNARQAADFAAATRQDITAEPRAPG